VHVNTIDFVLKWIYFTYRVYGMNIYVSNVHNNNPSTFQSQLLWSIKKEYSFKDYKQVVQYKPKR